jgi:thiamine-monophosphate kinase
LNTPGKSDPAAQTPRGGGSGSRPTAQTPRSGGPGGRPAAVISELGERGLIERIRQRLPPPSEALIVGIGDDAAVAQPDRGALQVLTTDALVEGVHFDRRFSSLSDVGYKALAVNVSDVAAMGGAPRLALVSMMLPEAAAVGEIDAIIDGLTEMARAAGVSVAGGNITRSPGPLAIDVMLVGSVRPRRVLERRGGRPGDALFVTGSVGAAAAGLSWLREHATRPDDSPTDSDMAACVSRYRRPEPRARVGALLGRTRTASACIDLSDGLSEALRQVAEASGTGARIDAAELPVPPAARAWFVERGDDPVRAAVAGGDDYELLFAVPKRRMKAVRAVERQARGVSITRIGELTAGPELVLDSQDHAEPLPGGFSHF